jgi:hypothetical protein
VPASLRLFAKDELQSLTVGMGTSAPQEIPFQGESRVAEQALQQIRQIVNSQSQDWAKKAQHKQVHSTSTVNCSETFTSNTNQVPGTSVLNSSHQFNVVFASKAKQRQLQSISPNCCVKI